MKNLYKIFTICLLSVSTLSFGQDIQFAQFFASPMYLNPAFTGADVCTRFSMNYRNQWPKIGNVYVSYLAAADHSVDEINSGIGLMAFRDVAGTGGLTTTSFNALYSYNLQLTRKYAVRMGLQAGQTIKSINFYDLTFGDQIARNGASTSFESPTSRSSFFDISAGLLLYSDKIWGGFSAHHINQPNQSLIQDESILPIKFSAHGGANFDLSGRGGKTREANSVNAVFNYKAQNKFDQLDLGVYGNFDPMVIGLWYRGIPLLKAYQRGYGNNDAIAVIVGVKMDNFKVGYSYEFTVSRLISSTDGAHELTLGYQFCSPKALRNKRRKSRGLRTTCPKF